MFRNFVMFRTLVLHWFLESRNSNSVFTAKTLNHKTKLVLVIQPPIFKSRIENIFILKALNLFNKYVMYHVWFFIMESLFILNAFFLWRRLWCIKNISEISYSFSRRKQFRNLHNTFFPYELVCYVSA